MNPPRGFFAYPSNPPSISETIRSAVAEINSTSVAEIMVWEQMRVGGTVIIDTICKHIRESDFLCADLTTTNPNVMFELGYAIGIDKRIWQVNDNSISESSEDIKTQCEIVVKL